MRQTKPHSRMRWTRATDESSRVVYCVPPAKHLATCSFAHRQSLAGFAQFYRNVGLLLPQTRWTRTGPRSGGVKAGSLPLAANGSVRARHMGKSKLNRVRRSPLNRTNRPGGLRHSGREAELLLVLAPAVVEDGVVRDGFTPRCEGPNQALFPRRTEKLCQAWPHVFRGGLALCYKRGGVIILLSHASL